MHEAAPVRRVEQVVVAVAQHLLPARREIDLVALDVEVPQAVVGRGLRELEALFELVQARLDAHALEARAHRVADELEQQLQVHVPRAARQRVGETEDAGRLALHAEGDEQHRTDLQLREAPAFGGLVLARGGGVADLGEAQVFEAALEPRIGFERRAAPGLDATLRERSVGGIDLVDRPRLGSEQPHEGRIDSTGVTQRVQGVADAGFDLPAAHVLEVDGNLGARDVDAKRLLAAAGRPHARREDVGCGQFRIFRCLSHSFRTLAPETQSGADAHHRFQRLTPPKVAMHSVTTNEEHKLSARC